MTKLVIHEAVHDEFQEAYLWYAKQSRTVAEKLRRHVRDAFDRIASQPKTGTAYDEGHRFYRVKNYPSPGHLPLFSRRRYCHNCRDLSSQSGSRLLAEQVIRR
jgi:plasmid stabilization system protein ParE